MTTPIKVPSLGESVTEATVARWLKQVGDPVRADEPLVELETDKVTIEVNAPAAGMLGEITAHAGTTIAVGAVLGIVRAGGAAAAPTASVTPISAPQAVAAVPSAAAAMPVSAPAAVTPLVMPAARKMVAENNLSPSAIAGTGKDGRITKGDVQDHLATGNLALAAHPQSVAANRTEERVRMTRLRQRIAQRLKEAQNTAAMLTTFNEVDMGTVMQLRKNYVEQFEKKNGIKLGFMSFFVKACLQALREFPAVNAEIQGEEIIYKNYYDIGVAVGTPQGLVVPIVRDAEVKSLADLEKEIAALGAKARDGKLSMAELTGGTFTISNGGVYGSLMSTPILNPPQSAILGMHKIQERPVAVNGQVVIRPMMYLALSYDHRIIDGREAVSFLVRVKDCIEDPQRLLLGI